MKNILFSLMAILFLAACYDDDSTLPSMEYPTIVADKSGEDSYLMGAYGSEFTYIPRLCKMVNRDSIPLTEEEFSDYTYRWTQTLLSNGNDTTTRVLSNERILNTIISSIPTGQYTYYTLTLHITHKASGVKKDLIWKMKITGVYGGALIIAETSDEKNSDISLIMSRTFNNDLKDYNADIVHHNAYSKNNNALIEGIVSQVSYVQSSEDYADITTLIEGKSLVRIEPVTMKYMDQDMDCFYYTPKVFNPQVIYESWGNHILINNGLVQYYNTNSGHKFTLDSESKYDLAKAYVGCLGYVDGIFFDKKAEKFVQFSTWDKEVLDLGPVGSGAFDPNNMKGFECIYGGTGNNKTARWLMKKEGHYFIYEMHQDKFTGLHIYDMENCPDLDKTSCYAFSAGNAEFYYSVGNILYIVPLSGDKPGRLVSYDKFGSQETITHILVHKDAGYTTWSEETDPATGESVPFWRKSANNVIVVVTYDGTEGRVYTLPIQYGGSGGIAPDKYVRCYDHFGRITGIGTRKQ